MEVSLRILRDQFERLQSSLLSSSPDESFAIGYAGWLEHDGRMTLVWRGFDLAPDDAYLRRGPAGAQVSPVFLAPGVKRVRSTGEALMICHTHPFSTTPGFSGIDDGGEDVLIPRIRDRAPDAPHGAIVIGTHGASARVWLPGSTGATTARFEIIGGDHSGNPDPGYDRQERALGPGTTAFLATRSVGIIGSGGLGWDIATLAWGHGVGRLVLVDDDLVEEHNLPRLRLANPSMIGMPKVEALAALLRESRPSGDVVAIPTKLADRSARTELALCDVIISATDNLASRLDADRMTKRLLQPMVDAGINIEVEGGALRRVGGRVNTIWPTAACLLCMGVFTPDDVAAEADPLGYRNQGRGQEAAVASFNATLAGLAVTEVLFILLNAGSDVTSSRYITYDGLGPRVRLVGVPAGQTCGTCAELVGATFGTIQ